MCRGFSNGASKKSHLKYQIDTVSVSGFASKRLDQLIVCWKHILRLKNVVQSVFGNAETPP